MNNKRKIFACPICGNRFPWYKLFILKSFLICDSCQSKIRVKKEAVTFNQGFFIGLVAFYVPFLISLYYKGCSFINSILIGIFFFLPVFITICIYTYIKSEFEKQ